jgi:hypothetical protein
VPGRRIRGRAPRQDWGKAMPGKIRETIVVGGVLGLLAVGIVFF